MKIDVLTKELVDEVVKDITFTGRCNYRDVLRRLNWARSRFSQQDWSEIKALAEAELGKARGLPKVKLLNVKELYFTWLDASPKKRASLTDDKGNVISPDKHPEVFCPVNKTPDGVVSVDAATAAMRDYVATNQVNHIDARVNSAMQLADTAAITGTKIAQLGRQEVKKHIAQTIGHAPERSIQNATAAPQVE